jgi:YD repeat-containing protein
MLGDPQRLADYDYDSQGRLTTVTRHLTATGGSAGGDGFVTTYGYGDSSSRIATVTQSDGTSLSFGYDAEGRLREVRDHAGAAAAHLEFVYGADPNSTAITDGNGL